MVFRLSLIEDNDLVLWHEHVGRVICRGQTFNMRVLSLYGKVKDMFAVLKDSSNPYNDVRTLMLEMIMEKQIFSVNEFRESLVVYVEN